MADTIPLMQVRWNTSAERYIEAMLPLNRDVPPEEVRSLFIAAGFTDVDFRKIRHYREGPRATFLFRGARP
jgi:hypothetical protein